jgi:hypothetical protein
VGLPDLLGECPHEDNPIDQRCSGVAASTERFAPLLYALEKTAGEAWRVGRYRRQVQLSNDPDDWSATTVITLDPSEEMTRGAEDELKVRQIQ